MDAGTKKGLRRLSAALSSAFSEWILIILLLIDAFFLYLATKICHSCKLQTPCLLCSRLCYLLGNDQKLGFYKNLVCDSHKLEISSLASCHAHQKLANSLQLCETCLLSFSSKLSCLERKFFNTSSGEELEVPLLKKDHERPCSCCSQPSRSMPHPFQLFQNKTAFKEFTLPDGWSKANGILPLPLTDDHSFFKYKELKITSESESEFPLSDDEDRSKRARRTVVVREESLKKSSAISENIVLGKLIHPDPAVSCTDPDHGWNSPIPSELVAESVPTGISNEYSGVDGSRTSTIHVEIMEDADLIDITSKSEMITSKNTDHNLSSEIALVLESARLHEDLVQRLSQIPSPRCLHYPWTDNNSQRCRKDEECKLFHSSSFHGLPSFNRTSNVDVLFSDGNTVRKVEGQIEIDRKSLSNLYKELEEERNASAIAANQAMAMITKLQEEKAAMQLEVMQYCRLMEEQTDHDQEAIRNLNDQLTEREKEILDLEAELESCRKLCGDDLLAEKILEQSFDSDESEYSTTSTPHISRCRGSKKHQRARVMFQDSAWTSSCPSKDNLQNFEDERHCISECLKKERNGGDDQHDGDDELDDECFGDDDAKRVKFQQGLSNKHSSPNFECLSVDENCSSPSVEPLSPIGEHEEHDEINSSCSSNRNLKTGKRKTGDEVEHLIGRLEELEAD